MNNKPKGIALFAGCGGCSLGFKNAGYDVVGFAESAESARKIYSTNFPESELLGSDVSKISNEMVENWKNKFGEIDVLFGGPPCQGFSLAGKRDIEDPRNILFLHFARIASRLKPKVVMLENVRVLTSMKAPDGSLVKDNIVAAFKEAGYSTEYRELNAQNFGVPQFRERVFFIGIRKDLKSEVIFPEVTHLDKIEINSLFNENLKPLKTFRDVCGDLESLESGEKSKTDPWHFAVVHPQHVIEQLKNVKEGESAHNNPDPKLRPKSGYNTTYKRIKWDEPCSAIGTTFAMISGSRNVHPNNTRSLTIREALRVQTFPDNFKLLGNLGQIRTAIGNAVPPLFAEVIAKHIKNNFITSSIILPTYKSNLLVS
jgi:DNA (cytosine-5)-methyltransferase 1